MRIWKKVCVTIASVAALLALSLFAVACGDNGEGAGEQSVVEIDYTVVVKDEDSGFAVENVEIKIWDAEKTTALRTGTTNENGAVAFKLQEGAYQLQFVAVPAPLDAESEFVNISVSESQKSTVLYVKDNSPAGSETKPIYLVVGEDSTVSVTLPANATVYYELRNLAGAELVLDSENVSVSYNGVTYEAQSGTVCVPIAKSENTWDLKKFAIVNKTDGELEVNGTLRTKPGASDNPFVIETLTQITEEINGKEIVCYKWTATKNGLFGVEGVSENADIILTNLRNSATTENRGETPISTLYLEVNEGDEVLIKVSAYGATDIGTYNVVFTVVEKDAA